MKKQNQKGFTLAELLIVVAIIAVLVAIAIPVFTKRLEQSRETTDIANLRSASAAATVAAMAGDFTTGSGYYDPNNEIGIVSSSGATLGRGTQADGGADLTTLPSVCSGYKRNTDARNKPIVITFSGGLVSSVAFK